MPHLTTLVDVDTLSAHLDDPAWVVVDCRFRLLEPDAGREMYRLGHLPGAVYAHLDRDLSAPVSIGSGRHPLPAPAQFERTLQNWGVSTSSQVVVYDDVGGAMASRLWWLMRWLGHGAAAVLDGGLPAWQASGHPLSSVSPSPAGGDFRAQPDDGLWVSTTQLDTELKHPGCLLVDVRAGERFRGEVEPIDPVAGHIPGSVNRPFETNNNDDGRFLAASGLRARWTDFLGDAPAQRVVQMCGSGVNACQSILAMEIAGLGVSRLYPGSWSEWIRDPDRAVATGP